MSSADIYEYHYVNDSSFSWGFHLEISFHGIICLDQFNRVPVDQDEKYVKFLIKNVKLMDGEIYGWCAFLMWNKLNYVLVFYLGCDMYWAIMAYFGISMENTLLKVNELLERAINSAKETITGNKYSYDFDHVSI